MGAFQELQDHLEAQRVQGDALQISSAILALARAKGWTQESTTVVAWLEELALDVAKNWRADESRPAPTVPQAEVDTVPISELRKMLKEARERKKAEP